MDSVKALLYKINENILNPVIALMFAIALLYFLYGVFEFVRDSDSSDGRGTGRSHMMWGFVGLLIMVSVYGIIQIIASTLGVEVPSQ